MTLWVAEPPAPYRIRPDAVVDASVLAAYVFQEPEAAEAESCLLPYTLHAPALLPLEVANVAVSKWRRGLAPAETLAERLAAFDFRCVQLHDAPVSLLFALSARYGLTAYDAAYLWLAAELRAPLFTFDARLGAAARDHLARPSAP